MVRFGLPPSLASLSMLSPSILRVLSLSEQGTIHASWAGGCPGRKEEDSLGILPLAGPWVTLTATVGLRVIAKVHEVPGPLFQVLQEVTSSLGYISKQRTLCLHVAPTCLRKNDQCGAFGSLLDTWAHYQPSAQRTHSSLILGSVSFVTFEPDGICEILQLRSPLCHLS